ncbi:uncharacterized protein [Rhodnius prolixus]
MSPWLRAICVVYLLFIPCAIKGQESEGPSESECRPFIEKALQGVNTPQTEDSSQPVDEAEQLDPSHLSSEIDTENTDTHDEPELPQQTDELEASEEKLEEANLVQSAENEDNGSEEREPALQQNEDDQRSERDVTEEQSDQPTESEENPDEAGENVHEQSKLTAESEEDTNVEEETEHKVVTDELFEQNSESKETVEVVEEVSVQEESKEEEESLNTEPQREETASEEAAQSVETESEAAETHQEADQIVEAELEKSEEEEVENEEKNIQSEEQEASLEEDIKSEEKSEKQLDETEQSAEETQTEEAATEELQSAETEEGKENPELEEAATLQTAQSVEIESVEEVEDSAKEEISQETKSEEEPAEEVQSSGTTLNEEVSDEIKEKMEEGGGESAEQSIEEKELREENEENVEPAKESEETTQETEEAETSATAEDDTASVEQLTSVEEPAVDESGHEEETSTVDEVSKEEEAPQKEEEAPQKEEELPQKDEEALEAEVAQKVEDETEPPEEEELIMVPEVPEKLRTRDHMGQILHLDAETEEIEQVLSKTVESTLKELKKLYDAAIKPLEILYKYRDLSNRHFGDPEIFSKPLILFMGPWSGGKSTIINYLLENEYKTTALRTGADPSPAYFNIVMWGEESEVVDGTQLAADWTFSGLQKFGQGLLDRLRGLKLNHPLLQKVNIVEIPGILEIRKQVERLFPFNDACQWFIDRADIIFLVYDPSKLDIGPETEAILDQLKGREMQTRIILNKADQVKPEELMRVQGTLIWNISPLMSSTEPPVMYSTSLWSLPYEAGSPTRLLHAQEKAFLADLRAAIDKRVENKIAGARRFAVRVRNHAKMVDCYLTTYYNHKSFFDNKKHVSDDIIEHPQNYHIYEGLSTLTNISRYDLPDPDVYRDFFRLNPVYEFQQLSATCTYFRGCPINRLDLAIAYDLPELIGKYKKSVEELLRAHNSRK